MTDTAWKSGTFRGSPTWPMRISLWTEPGRWTRRMTRLLSAGVASTGVGAALPGSGSHSPKSRFAIDGTSWPERSPPTTSVMSGGLMPRR